MYQKPRVQASPGASGPVAKLDIAWDFYVVGLVFTRCHPEIAGSTPARVIFF